MGVCFHLEIVVCDDVHVLTSSNFDKTTTTYLLSCLICVNASNDIPWNTDTEWNWNHKRNGWEKEREIERETQRQRQRQSVSEREINIAAGWKVRARGIAEGENDWLTDWLTWLSNRMIESKKEMAWLLIHYI